MKKITVWRRKNEDGVFEHNHIEDGWIEGEYPIPTNIWYGEKEVELSLLDVNSNEYYEKLEYVKLLRKRNTHLLNTWKKYKWEKEFK